MASIATDPNGRRRLGFTGADGRRRTVRIGKVSAKAAETMRHHLEALLAARLTGTAPPRHTAQWVAELPDVLHGRIARAGLCEPREPDGVGTLGEMIRGCIDANGGKPSTITRMRQAERSLVEYFGEDADPGAITLGDAEDWQAALRDRYSDATVARTTIYARQFFRWGSRRGCVNANPFAELRAGRQSNPDRQVFVPRDIIDKVIEAAPDAEWRAMIALGRYAALRVPSEVLALRWGDIDWANSRMWVRSRKTEHHAGGEGRMVPVFPEVRPHLMRLFEDAEPGADRVIERFRDGQNVNTHFRRVIRRAGIAPWPRTWHNLRASRQTELAAAFPLATVCSWVGNSKLVAAGHYLQVTDADWERAVGKSDAESDARAAQNPTLHATAPDRTDSHGEPQHSAEQRLMRSLASVCDPTRSGLVGVTGLEPVTSAV